MKQRLETKKAVKVNEDGVRQSCEYASVPLDLIHCQIKGGGNLWALMNKPSRNHSSKKKQKRNHTNAEIEISETTREAWQPTIRQQVLPRPKSGDVFLIILTKNTTITEACLLPYGIVQYRASITSWANTITFSVRSKRIGSLVSSAHPLGGWDPKFGSTSSFPNFKSH